MLSSSFYVCGATAIDAVNPATMLPGNFNTGMLLIGQTKAVMRRSLTLFDVFGVAAEGRPLLADDVLLDARLECEVIGMSGPAGFACSLERISRLDWDYVTAEWNHYRVATAWTSPGGDVGATPPAVAYASPLAMGAFVIPGVLPFVADAVANRGGMVHLRHKAADEVTGHYFALAASPTRSDRIRLRVAYESAEPSPIDRPRAGDAGTAPEAASRPARAIPSAKPAQPEQPAGGR